MLSSLGAGTKIVGLSGPGSVLETKEQKRVCALRARIEQLFSERKDANGKMRCSIRKEIVACLKAVRKLEKQIAAFAQSRMQFAGRQAGD